jgi:hypothetical protein
MLTAAIYLKLARAALNKQTNKNFFTYCSCLHLVFSFLHSVVVLPIVVDPSVVEVLSTVASTTKKLKFI